METYARFVSARFRGFPKMVSSSRLDRFCRLREQGRCARSSAARRCVRPKIRIKTMRSVDRVVGRPAVAGYRSQIDRAAADQPATPRWGDRSRRQRSASRGLIADSARRWPASRHPVRSSAAMAERIAVGRPRGLGAVRRGTDAWRCCSIDQFTDAADSSRAAGKHSMLKSPALWAASCVGRRRPSRAILRVDGHRRQNSLSCALWCAALSLRIIPNQRICGASETAGKRRRR